jgi:hypothetical protein
MAGAQFDNPFYAKLAHAVNGMRRDAADLERMINRSFDSMTGQGIHRDLSDQRRELRWALVNIVQAAEEALRNTPTKVTAEEAVHGGKGPYGAPSLW